MLEGSHFCIGMGNKLATEILCHDISGSYNEFADDCLLGCCGPTFRGCLLKINFPEDGGRKHLRNVGKFVPDYLKKHPKGQLSTPVIMFTVGIFVSSVSLWFTRNATCIGVSLSILCVLQRN